MRIVQLLLSLGDATERLGALITCLKRAKMMGLVKQNEDKVYSKEYHGNDMWRDVVFISTLKQALCCHEEQVCRSVISLFAANRSQRAQLLWHRLFYYYFSCRLALMH